MPLPRLDTHVPAPRAWLRTALPPPRFVVVDVPVVEAPRHPAWIRDAVFYGAGVVTGIVLLASGALGVWAAVIER